MWDDDETIERLTVDMRNRIAAGEGKAAFAELRETCIRMFDDEWYGLRFAGMIRSRAYATLGPGR
jgi:hypothetical protein